MVKKEKGEIMVKKRNNKQELYRIIKDKILYYDLKPGQIINEDALANELSVSRTPIREILLKLSDENFISIYPSKGTFVSLIDLNILKEYAYMRHVLECDILIKMAKEKTQIKDSFEDLILMQKFHEKNNNIKEYVKYDHKFHLRLFERAGHGLIWQSIEPFYSHTIRYNMLDFEKSGYMKISISEHEEILNAIESGNVKLLKNVLERHHDYYFSEYGTLMEKYSSFFAEADS